MDVLGADRGRARQEVGSSEVIDDGLELFPEIARVVAAAGLLVDLLEDHMPEAAAPVPGGRLGQDGGPVGIVAHRIADVIADLFHDLGEVVPGVDEGIEVTGVATAAPAAAVVVVVARRGQQCVDDGGLAGASASDDQRAAPRQDLIEQVDLGQQQSRLLVFGPPDDPLVAERSQGVLRCQEVAIFHEASRRLSTSGRR